ncbi:hypothetical protein BGW80DRAFT_1320540 [Lactifluus volemus]|nr:hypothetical protein BGW80DRAFT_1320540 [Lactifluus volemus]
MNWRLYATFVYASCPCSAPLPALFGLHIATCVLCELTGRPTDPCPSAIARRLVNGCGSTLLHRRLTNQIAPADDGRDCVAL